MNKPKIIVLLILSYLLIFNGIYLDRAYSNENIIPVSKQLKGAVINYKLEYINEKWWQKFNDPILMDYIYKAADKNYDVKIAALKVLESQSIAREYLGREFPVLSLGPSFIRQKTSDNISMGEFKLPEYTQNTIIFPLNVGYELDLWRKNREKTIRASKELQAIKYDEKAAYISLTSNVAAAYLNLVKTDKLIEIQKEILDLRKNIFDITIEKHKYGLASKDEVLRSEKAYIESKSILNDLEKSQNISLNQLAVLTCENIENAVYFKRNSFDNLLLIKDLPSDFNSNEILNRPDILKEEAELQKSRIDVNLARKDLLPSITLTGQFGFNANAFSKLLNWDSYILSGGSGIFQSIFTGGQKRYRLKAKKFYYQQKLQNYQKTILLAFQEVNDSLFSLKKDFQGNENNLKEIELEKESLNIANLKYEQGFISYIELLHQKEKLMIAQQKQISSKTACFADLLSVYKSVGGQL